MECGGADARRGPGRRGLETAFGDATEFAMHLEHGPSAHDASDR